MSTSASGKTVPSRIPGFLVQIVREHCYAIDVEPPHGKWEWDEVHRRRFWVGIRTWRMWLKAVKVKHPSVSVRS